MIFSEPVYNKKNKKFLPLYSLSFYNLLSIITLK